MLSLALDEPSTFRLASGYGVHGADRVRRVLSLHRRALTAEREGVRARADFYWREAIEALRGVWEDDRAWEAAASQSGLTVSGRELRDAVMMDLFADTHRGLFMAYFDDEASITNRAFVHGKYLRTLTAFAGLPRDRKYAILRPLAEREIAACRRSEQWEGARDLATSMMALAPDADVFHDLLVEIELEALGRGLSNDTSAAEATRDAEVIGKLIERFEAWLERHPTTLSFFDALGVLHRARAVRLANAFMLSKALLAVEKAVAYGGDDDDSMALRRQLQDLLRQQQEAVQKLVAQVNATPNAQLNDAGRVLQRDAMSGEASAKAFKESRRSSIVSARRRAQACSLFRRIGIAAPAANIDQIAKDLRNAVESVSQRRPETDEDLTNCWADAVKLSPRLRELDQDGVLRFLRNALHGDPEEEALSRLALGFTAPAPRPGQEPFAMWLCSRRNVAIKFFAAAAVVAMLFTGTSAIREAVVRQARDSAFSSVRAAAEANDDAAVVRAAREFLATTQPDGEDPSRVAEVRALYGQAVTRRFLAGNSVAEAQRELQQYRTHLASMVQKGAVR